jgi:Mg2+-importing ATPase
MRPGLRRASAGRPARRLEARLLAPDRPFWAQPAGEVSAGLGSTTGGLTAASAAERLARVGPNTVVAQDRAGPLRLLLHQFASPLVLILVFGAAVSVVLHDWVDAAIILVIVAGSGLLGFVQEFRASRAMEELQRRLELVVTVLRDGRAAQVPVSSVVPGDVALLSAGNLVPADGLVLEARDFLVSEAALTGESYPVEKQPGTVPADAPPAARSNAVFLGSSVRSGTARVLVVETGMRTAYGAIAARLRRRPPETDFARGLRRFGGLLMRVMVFVVLFVLVVNQALGRPLPESLLFAVALAVGLSPELLPAIVSVTLSAGARHLARGGVIVRRLEAIENLGSMDVLCTDKTGTLTTGVVTLESAVLPGGAPSAGLRRLAFLNAALETGIANPLDAALVAMGEAEGLSAGGVRKVDEIPYDFLRRRLTIVVEDPAAPGSHLMITKGAFASVLEACASVGDGDTGQPLDAPARAALAAFFEAQGERGLRALALATRRLPPRPRYSREDEAGLVFRGFLLFLDPPKPGGERAIADLAARGIAVKVISGDSRHVTAHLASLVGLRPTAILTGSQVSGMRDEALWHEAPLTDLFVEIDPQQKERIVRALQRAGHAVGFLGDGINDAPALHAADVGISVDGAVDVARESADVVLMRPDLDMLRQGVEDGRRSFANTLKYISITTSANFGNMISMALVTPLLPFLPLLPKQVLLNNLLSDLPSVAISTDNVDAGQFERPQRWDLRRLQRFMIVFGLVSSGFDLLTFAVLLHVLAAGADEFRTAWFVVSLLTELAVVLVLRTGGRALASRPSRLLLWTTVVVSAASLALPYLGRPSALLGFVPLPASLLGFALAVVVAYVVATEAVKLRLHRALLGRGSAA